MSLDQAKAAYRAHKCRAAKRGIEFLLTFEQWWELWEPHWDRRGLGALDMCMCRTHDEGPYAVGNVRIATNKENHHERAMMERIKRTPKKYRTSREYRTPMDNSMVGWMSGKYR